LSQLVSGSGPTVLGLFMGSRDAPRSGPDLADRAAGTLAERVPSSLSAVPVGEAFARPVTLADAAPAVT
jgi:hypothetical protein